MSAARQREILICGTQWDQELRQGSMSILELAPIAARLGVQGIEYRDVYWKDKESELPAVRDQLQQLGLKATYATFTTLFNRDPAQQAQLMQDLEDARALGSPLLRVFRGPRPWDDPDGPSMLEAVRPVMERAQSYGMLLALENFVGIPGNRMEEVREVLERLDSPVLGTNIDTSNYPLNDQDTIAAIRSLAPWIVYSHLKDGKRTVEGLKSTRLGNGTLPMREIIAALDATGRSFPLCFEFGGEGDPEGAITKSLAFLATL